MPNWVEMVGVIGCWTLAIRVVSNSGHTQQYKWLIENNLGSNLHRQRSGRVEYWHIIHKVFSMNWFSKSSQNQTKWKASHQSRIAKTKLDVLAGRCGCCQVAQNGANWPKNVIMWSSTMLTAMGVLVASCWLCWQKKAIPEKDEKKAVPQSFGKHWRNEETKNNFNPRKLGGPCGNPTENGWSLGQSHGKWVVIDRRSEWCNPNKKGSCRAECQHNFNIPDKLNQLLMPETWRYFQQTHLLLGQYTLWGVHMSNLQIDIEVHLVFNDETYYIHARSLRC